MPSRTSYQERMTDMQIKCLKNQLAIETDLLRARYERLTGTATYLSADECKTRLEAVMDKARKRHGK